LPKTLSDVKKNALEIAFNLSAGLRSGGTVLRRTLRPSITSRLRSMNSKPDSIATWRCPVLFTHGDDDRNVPFQQTTDLVKNCAAKKSHSKN
jgi:fermentation-respiration switch protein FrsA (DUF1100 family)